MAVFDHFAWLHVPDSTIRYRLQVDGRACCRSSVVEHSLGKGEVESSIPSGSTIPKLLFLLGILLQPQALSIVGLSHGASSRARGPWIGGLMVACPLLGHAMRHATGDVIGRE